MTREFRFFDKKRGSRRTGSSTQGRFLLGAFFTIALLVGCAALALLIAEYLIPEWRVNQNFVETQCVVLDKKIAERGEGSGVQYRPEFQIRYEVNGQPQEVWVTNHISGSYSSSAAPSQRVLDEFQTGQSYPCWYDPRKPDSVVLSRGYSWSAALLGLVPLTFIFIGGAGLYYIWRQTGISVEQRSILEQRASERALFELQSKEENAFPTVPSEERSLDSAGTTLRYRLPTGSASWSLWGAAALCLFWNGIVSVFVTIAIRSHLRGEPEWFLTLFLIPFVAVGGWTIYLFVRQLLITSGVGPTLVEISDHPLRPGGTYEILVSQTGRLKIDEIKVKLVCEETATYRQGTNTRTTHRRVYDREIVTERDCEIQSGLPLEIRATMAVPSPAMHSFQTSHNRVEWKVIVEGQLPRWPDFSRDFAVILQPDG